MTCVVLIMIQVYYKEAVGAFLVFDNTRMSTFDAVAKWKNDIDAKVHLPDGRPIPVVILANKVLCDAYQCHCRAIWARMLLNT